MDTTLVVSSLCSAAIGFALGYLAARCYLRTPGNPQPTSIDCVNGKIYGRMSPPGASEPNRFHVCLYASQPSPLPTQPHSGCTVCSHTWSGPDFVLTGVPFTCTPGMTVYVMVFAQYGGNHYGAGAAFTCDAGSGAVTAGGGGGAAAPLFRIAPRQYRLTIGHLLAGDPGWLRELGATAPVVLAHADRGRDDDRWCCWEATSAAGVNCRLVVAGGCCSDRASGKLTLSIPENGEAAQQLTYRTDYWNFTGHNRLALAAAGLKGDLPRTMTITPA
jgi:hypothetical protein